MLHLVDSPTEEFEHRRIGPVHILVSGEYRLFCRQARYLLQEGLEDALFLLMWTELRLRRSLIDRDRQQLCKEWSHLERVRRCQREHRCELIELLFWSILSPYSGGPFKQSNNGVQCAVGVKWRAEVT